MSRPIGRRPLRRALLATCAAAATSLTALLAAGPALAAYPERPITLIVPWGAGGGTDAVARFIASELEKEVKQPINVVNRIGGSGVVGHPRSRVRGARRLHHRHHHCRDRDDEARRPDQAGSGRLHPAGMVNYDPNALFVRADSKIKDVKDLIEAGQGQPGQAQGQRHRPGRHLAPGPRRHAGRCQAARQRGRLGSEPRVPRPGCRTWSPAASISRPVRCPKPARWWRPARSGPWC